MKTRARTIAKLPRGVPFENGDRLTQQDFHRLYLQVPDKVKAELIGGEVYMPSPVRHPHSRYSRLISWLFMNYELATAGVSGGDNSTLILGSRSEPQPDHCLRLLPEYGGMSRVNEDEYLVGAAELLVEIAHSTVAVDLTRKKDDYSAAGVQEYLVVCVDERELRWFHFPSRRKLHGDKHGVWKSRVFPGLWIHEASLFSENLPRFEEVARQGIASPEHSQFVHELARRRTKA